MLDERLLQAYRETEYRVFGSRPACLLIDRPCPALHALHRDSGVDCSVFVSAVNPASRLLDDDANRRRHRALKKELEASGLTAIEGEGRHPAGNWPAEPGWLVPGLTSAAARRLGRRWGQNAIVFSGADAVPRLVVLAGDAGPEAAQSSM